MQDDNTLATTIPRLPVIPFHNYLYRAVDWAYHDTINSVIGSVKAHGRYHHRDDALGTIYLSEYASGATDELRQERRSLFPPLPGKKEEELTVIPSFLVSVTRLIDLRRPDIHHQVGSNLMELTGDWRLQLQFEKRTETQRLARAAKNAGVEGLIYTSAVGAGGVNVVLFSSNLSQQMQASLPQSFPAQRVQFVGQM